MIKPERLRKGDKVAIVSLSSGMLGEKEFLHKYELGKKRLEEKFGLEVVAMPNALKGIDYLYEHPEKRAEDLMNAFKDKSIKAIICAIGGDDTIRLLPYIDYEVIRSNPKILDASRRKRIAGGCGQEVYDVNRLIQQYDQLKKVMTKMYEHGPGFMQNMFNNVKR